MGRFFDFVDISSVLELVLLIFLFLLFLIFSFFVRFEFLIFDLVSFSFLEAESLCFNLDCFFILSEISNFLLDFDLLESLESIIILLIILRDEIPVLLARARLLKLIFFSESADCSILRRLLLGSLEGTSFLSKICASEVQCLNLLSEDCSFKMTPGSCSRFEESWLLLSRLLFDDFPNLPVSVFCCAHLSGSIPVSTCLVKSGLLLEVLFPIPMAMGLFSG